MQESSSASTSSGLSRPAVLQGVWRFRWAVLGLTLLGALAGWGFSEAQPVRYEATGELLITDPRDAGVFRDVGPSIGSVDRYVRNEAQRLSSSTVAMRASELLGGAVTAEEVRHRIQAAAASDSDLITVTASGPTAEEAAEVANAVMEAYEEIVGAEIREQALASVAELQDAQIELRARVVEAERALQASPDDEVAEFERDAAVEQLIANQRLIERISVDAALYGSGVEMLEPAFPTDSPVAPRTLMNVLLATLLGFGAAAAAAVWRAQAQQRADRRHEPAAILEVPLLGAVPELGDLSGADAYPTASAPESAAAEAFRFAVAAVEHTLDSSMSTIVVTSPQAGDGKSVVALNLAAVLAQENRRVLLADADLRVRGLTELTGVPTGPGLTDLADQAQPFEAAVHTWAPAWWLQLPVVPGGGRDVNPAAFFRTSLYRAALNRLQQRTDLLVIDAPPLLAASDASAIAGSADAIILVVRRGTPLHVLTDLQDRLAFVGTPVLGYIFNRATDKRAGYGYSYAQGHSNGFAPGAGPGAPPATASPLQTPSGMPPSAGSAPSERAPASAVKEPFPKHGSG